MKETVIDLLPARLGLVPRARVGVCGSAGVAAHHGAQHYQRCTM